MKRRDFRILEQERIARRILNRRNVDRGIKKFLAISGLSLVVGFWIIGNDISIFPNKNNEKVDLNTENVVEKRIELDENNIRPINIDEDMKEYNAIESLLNKAYDKVQSTKEALDEFDLEVID